MRVQSSGDRLWLVGFRARDCVRCSKFGIAPQGSRVERPRFRVRRWGLGWKIGMQRTGAETLELLNPYPTLPLLAILPFLLGF